MLQFITNSDTVDGTISQIISVINGGCKWVQIRMKEKPVEVIGEVIDSVAPVCKQNGVTLIVDDHVELALRDDVNGVHLGQKDMSVDEAREILGADKIIGLTINNENQALSSKDLPVNYFGVGPLRFTSTKKALAPILGETGIGRIIRVLKLLHPQSSIVVIGGVQIDDIKSIISIGADGVAVSGSISGSGNPVDNTKRFVKEINYYNKLNK